MYRLLLQRAISGSGVISNRGHKLPAQAAKIWLIRWLRHNFSSLIVFLCLLLALVGCSEPPQSRVVFITATPDAGHLTPHPSAEARDTDSGNPTTALPTPSTDLPLGTAVATSSERAVHIVSTGETLFSIAQRYNTTIDRLVEMNQLINPDVITVGQSLEVPSGGQLVTPSLILLSDTRFVRGPGAEFNVSTFVGAQPGLLSRTLQPVTHRRADGRSELRFLSGAEIVELVSLETSVDARLLLSVLEYRAAWLSNPMPQNIEWPLVSEEASLGIDRQGLYKQLSWAANELNRGYYGWKYGNWKAMEFVDGPRIQFDRTLNAGTVALHHMLHLNRAPGDWLHDVSPDGWADVYYRLFGGTLGVSEPILLEAPPEMTLPYAFGETWLLTGGHHGGWGTGSAWAALDFAPPDERPTDTLCYTSRFAARAVADGIIARSGHGVVVLDLDGDGNERTGWTVLYLHLDAASAVEAGMVVVAGDMIGYPACEGGFSTATHLHIARRYNGEWVPADCQTCSDDRYDFIMSGWQTIGFAGQEYQGQLRRGSETRTAEQAANDPINQVKHD